jgi:hypothetical protein
VKHFCPVPSGRERRVLEILLALGFDAEMLAIKRKINRRMTAARRREIEEKGKDKVAMISGFVIINFNGHKPEIMRQMIERGIIRRGRTFRVTDSDIDRMVTRHAEMCGAALSKSMPRLYRPGDVAEIALGYAEGRQIVIKEVNSKHVTGYVNGTLVKVKREALEAA